MKIEVDERDFDDLRERIRLLNAVALSALALKQRIEHGFPPVLFALDRDLGMYFRYAGAQKRNAEKEEV